MLSRSDLHSYQRRAVQFIKDNKRCALFVDMGLGKTVSTLTAVQDMFDSFDVFKVLVIAPLRVAKATWPGEINAWGHINLPYSVVVGDPKVRAKAVASSSPLHITNIDNLVWLIEHLRDEWPYDMVVIDESSMFKNASTKRFKALRKVLKHIERVVLLTGTPAPNGLLDLWPQMYLLDEGKRLLRSMTAYKAHWFESDYMGYKWTPRKGAGAEIHARIADLCLRLDAKDYLEMPARIDRVMPVVMDPKHSDLYQQLERDMLLELKNGEVTALSAGVLAGKLLQFANGAMYHEGGGFEVVHTEKVHALKEIAETSAGHPMLVAYNYKSDLERLLDAFPNAKVLDKDTRMIERWNRGEIEMLLAHPASAGHGLNLQAGGSIIVWFGLPWSLEHYQQFNARLHRQGQTQSVVVHHLVNQGTIDEDVMAALSQKEATQSHLLNALRRRAA